MAEVLKRQHEEGGEEAELLVAFKRARRAVREQRAASACCDPFARRKRAAAEDEDERQASRQRCGGAFEELVEEAVARRLEGTCASVLEAEVVQEQIERSVEQRLDEVQAELARQLQASSARELRHAEELAAKDRELTWQRRQHEEQYERVLRLWQDSEKAATAVLLLSRCSLTASAALAPRFGLA